MQELVFFVSFIFGHCNAKCILFNIKTYHLWRHTLYAVSCTQFLVLSVQYLVLSPQYLVSTIQYLLCGGTDPIATFFDSPRRFYRRGQKSFMARYLDNVSQSHFSIYFLWKIDNLSSISGKPHGRVTHSPMYCFFRREIWILQFGTEIHDSEFVFVPFIPHKDIFYFHIQVRWICSICINAKMLQCQLKRVHIACQLSVQLRYLACSQFIEI